MTAECGIDGAGREHAERVLSGIEEGLLGSPTVEQVVTEARDDLRKYGDRDTSDADEREHKRC